jgi:hypothetical protein
MLELSCQSARSAARAVVQNAFFFVFKEGPVPVMMQTFAESLFDMTLLLDKLVRRLLTFRR